MNKQYESRLLLTLDDPLSADVGDKELTKYPLLPAERLLKFEITSATKEAGKKDPTKENLKIVCALREDGAVSTDGDAIHQGFTITIYIGVTPTEKRTITNIRADVARWAQGIGLKGLSVREVIDDIGKHFTGKMVNCKTSISKETAEFPASNWLTPVPAS